MNKTFKLLVVPVIVLVVALALNFTTTGTIQPTAIQTSSAVQIPEALILAANALAIGLFTAGFVYLFEVTGIDFREQAIPLALSAATWVVAEAQGWINSLPETTDPWISIILRVLVVLVPAAGLLRLFSRQPATLLEHSAQRLG